MFGAGHRRRARAGRAGRLWTTRRWTPRSPASSRPSPGGATTRVVSIAAVQGHAVGAGFQLALACDLRVLADDAQLSMKEPSPRAGARPGGTKPLVDAGRLLPRAGDLRDRTLGGRGRGGADRAGQPRRTVARSSTRPPATWPPPCWPRRPAPCARPRRCCAGPAGRTYDEQRAAERAAQAGRLRDLARGGDRRVDLVLSDDQRAVRAAVREWVDEVVVPRRPAQRPRGALPAGGARRAQADRLRRACRSTRRTAAAAPTR